MTVWIRSCLFLICFTLASQAEAQNDSPAKTPPSLREQKLDYALRIAMAQREFDRNNVARARQLLESCPRDLRRWEWHYLRRLCNSELKSVQVQKEFETVRLSPDGRHFVLRSRRSIVVRSLSDEKDIFELKGFYRDAAFSHDGQTLAVIGLESVSLVDVSDGTIQKEIQVTAGGRDDRIRSVSFSRDGGRLATVRFFIVDRWRMCELTIWDVGTAKSLKIFTDLPLSTKQVHFSPNGKLLAACAVGSGAEGPFPGEIRIWNIETGKRIHKLRTYDPDDSLESEGHYITDFLFSHDGAHLVTGGSDGLVRVWEVGSGSQIRSLKAHHGSVTSVAFDRFRSRIVSGGEDRVVRVWDMATGTEINSMRGEDGRIKTVAFLDGLRVASVGQSIRIWDAAAPQQARTYKRPDTDAGVYGIAFGPKSGLLATASLQEARIRSVKLGRARRFEEVIQPLSSPPGPDITFSPDGRLIGTTGKGGGKLWDVATGELVHALPDGARSSFTSTFSIDFDPSGSLVATTGQRQLAIWKQKTGELLRKIEIKKGRSRCVVFSPDGKRVATGLRGTKSRDRILPAEINFWDVKTGELKLSITASGTKSMQLSYDPAGRRIAATTGNHVTLFDTGNGDKLMELHGHSATVNGVAFSPDGDRIATCSDDQTIKIWDAESGQELLSLRGHNASVVRVAFSRNGLHLASSSAKPSVVKLWDATLPGQLSVQALEVDQTAQQERQPLSKFPERSATPKSTEAEQTKITVANVSKIALIKEVELAGRAPVLEFGPTSGEITIVDARQPLEILDQRELQPTRKVVSDFRPLSFAASRDGRSVAWSDGTRAIIETLADNRQVVLDVKYRNATLDFSPDGKLLATGGYGTRARIWDVATGELRFMLDTEALARGMISSQFSPDGKLIAVSHSGWKTCVFDAGTGDVVYVLPDLRARVIAFRPDSKVLAASYVLDGQIRLWDMQNGKLLKSAKASGGRPATLDWTPDGGLLVTGGRGLVFWDAGTMNQVHAILDIGFIRRVRFTADGTRLLCSAIVGRRNRVGKVLSLIVPVK